MERCSWYEQESLSSEQALPIALNGRTTAALIRLISAFRVIHVICKENMEAFTPKHFQVVHHTQPVGIRGTQVTVIEGTLGFSVQLNSRQQETHLIPNPPWVQAP
ncbi:hypothetical protein P7K49_039411, partial [Saguinus oedipus]